MESRYRYINQKGREVDHVFVDGKWLRCTVDGEVYSDIESEEKLRPGIRVNWREDDEQLIQSLAEAGFHKMEGRVDG